MNPIASGFGADIKNLVAHSACASEKDAVCFDQPQAERVDQNIAVVTGIKIDFPAHSGNAGAVAITGDTIDYTIEQEAGAGFFQISEA